MNSHYLLRRLTDKTISFDREVYFTSNEITQLMTRLADVYAANNNISGDVDLTEYTDSTEYKILTLLIDSSDDGVFSTFLILNNLDVISMTMLVSHFNNDDNDLTIDSLLKYILQYDTVHVFQRKMELYDIMKKSNIQLDDGDNYMSMLSFINNNYADGEDDYIDLDNIITKYSYYKPVINNVMDNATSFRNMRTAIVDYKSKMSGIDLGTTSYPSSISTETITDMVTGLLNNESLLIMPIDNNSIFKNSSHMRFYKDTLYLSQKPSLNTFLRHLDKLMDIIVLDGLDDESFRSDFFMYIKEYAPSSVTNSDDLEKMKFVNMFSNDYNDTIDLIYKEMDKVTDTISEICKVLDNDSRYTKKN